MSSTIAPASSEAPTPAPPEGGVPASPEGAVPASPESPAASEQTYWLIQRIDAKESRECVGDLVAGRAAWLAAIAGGRAAYAALSGTGSNGLSTWPCEWSKAGTFHDRTAAHREEMAALAARLIAEAREGFSVTLRDEPRGWRIVFQGARTEHSLLGSASTAERIQTHWCIYSVRSEGV